MEYSKFRMILLEGEKRNIDFKIRCDAFLNPSKSSKGELAKDICAMANNGNIASFIIIGVADNGEDCRSVDNPKLIDDNLQDFCKKAISPPPKIRLYRKSWERAESAHKGKEFVIIQVGPNPKQVFRLAQDFIEYDTNTCYRRNEVWIRRVATTDLATPDEIVRLARGSSLDESDEDAQKKVERLSFLRLSLEERQNLVSSQITVRLRQFGYKQVRRRDWGKINGWIGDNFIGGVETRWKTIESNVLIAYILKCMPTLTIKGLQSLSWSPVLNLSRFTQWSGLPKDILKIDRANIKSVRRLCIISVIRAVPANRVEIALPGMRRIGKFLYYYQPTFSEKRYTRSSELELPSSTELLILSQIQSVRDYDELLVKTILSLESEKATIVIPSPAQLSDNP
jgi:hypothetical protein